MIESSGIAQWIYETLAADSVITDLVGTRLFDEVAPQGTAYPLVRFEQMSSVDVMGATESTRIMVNELWLIRAIAETSSYRGGLLTLANRIDDLFQNNAGEVVGTNIFSSARDSAFRQYNVDQGVSFRHLGGIYRIYAQGV